MIEVLRHAILTGFLLFIVVSTTVLSASGTVMVEPRDEAIYISYNNAEYKLTGYLDYNVTIAQNRTIVVGIYEVPATLPLNSSLAYSNGTGELFVSVSDGTVIYANLTGQGQDISFTGTIYPATNSSLPSHDDVNIAIQYASICIPVEIVITNNSVEGIIKTSEVLGNRTIHELTINILSSNTSTIYMYMVMTPESPDPLVEAESLLYAVARTISVESAGGTPTTVQLVNATDYERIRDAVETYRPKSAYVGVVARIQASQNGVTMKVALLKSASSNQTATPHETEKPLSGDHSPPRITVRENEPDLGLAFLLGLVVLVIIVVGGVIYYAQHH